MLAENYSPELADSTRPRVVLIGASVLNDRVGAGVTLSALFHGWPPENLAQIHTADEDPDPSVCGRSFRLEPVVTSAMTGRARHMRNLARTVSSFLSSEGLSPKLIRWLDDFRPQAVFSQLGDLATGRITLRVAGRYRIPLALHISDDYMPGWPANAIGREIPPITNLANWYLRKLFLKCAHTARRRMSISTSMSQAYRERYGLEFSPFYNAVDPAEWPERLPAAVPLTRPVRIVYSGSIFHNGQFQALCDIRDAVMRLREEGISIRLEIFTAQWSSQEHRNAFHMPPAVEIFDLVPKAKLRDNLTSADVLLLPVSFEPAAISFIRHSIPGKVAEYLMCGTPVLAYGPKEVAQIQFLTERGCAEVVSERDGSALADAIRRLATDEEHRVRLSARAREVALSEFNLPVLRERFQDAIATMVA